MSTTEKEDAMGWLKTTRSPALTLLALAVAWSTAACGAGDADAAADRAAVDAGEAQEAATRYVRYEHEGDVSYGILEEETIRELDGAPFDAPSPTGAVVGIDEARLLTPVDPMRISKVVGTAVNTRRPGLELPEDAHPRWFAKFPTSLNPTGGEVELPPEAGNLNYEGELVVIIGREARHVSEEDALDHVFGYAVGNDFSENTWYGEGAGREGPSRMISKGADSWACLGPMIVTGIDYRGRRVVTRLNGEIVQEGTTDDLIQDVPELISDLSRYVTLLPGDVIYTGTVLFEEGARRRMEPGDELEVTIEGLGTVRNTIAPMRVPGETTEEE
ncbi:MAG: fumarylacetoacetate hydrolase family protein [Gemmatimonadota bacterium]